MSDNYKETLAIMAHYVEDRSKNDNINNQLGNNVIEIGRRQ